jgi:hypothetical protein
MQPEAQHKNPPLSLGESLVGPIYLGDETLTIRMGEKYRTGRYRPGAVEFAVTDSNFRIATEILSVNESGKRIRDLTAAEMRMNGCYLPENPSKEDLKDARRKVLESMQHWYPNETFNGLNTRVYPIEFRSPEETADLRQMRKIFGEMLESKFAATEIRARYYPSFDSYNPEVKMFVIDCRIAAKDEERFLNFVDKMEASVNKFNPEIYKSLPDGWESVFSSEVEAWQGDPWIGPSIWDEVPDHYDVNFQMEFTDVESALKAVMRIEQKLGKKR